jgi:hypothetical protein
MRDLSPKIISGDHRQSENMQTQYISIQNHNIEIEVELLHIQCYVLEFAKDEAKRALQMIQ